MPESRMMAVHQSSHYVAAALVPCGAPIAEVDHGFPWSVRLVVILPCESPYEADAVMGQIESGVTRLVVWLTEQTGVTWSALDEKSVLFESATTKHGKGGAE